MGTVVGSRPYISMKTIIYAGPPNREVLGAALFKSSLHPALLGFLALIATTLALIPVRAQLAETWVHRDTSVSSNAYDRAVQVATDATGDLVVTGVTGGGISVTDMVTIKYSGATGAMLWRQQYNGPAGFDDAPAALAVDANGDIVMSGPSAGESWYDSDFYTAKYSGKDGLLLWERRDGRYPEREYPKAIAVDSEGNVIVTGFASNGGKSTTYVAKYAGANGHLLWGRSFEGTGYNADAEGAAAVDSEGDIVVTTTVANGASRLVIKLTAATGISLWSQRTPRGGRALAVIAVATSLPEDPWAR